MLLRLVLAIGSLFVLTAAATAQGTIGTVIVANVTPFSGDGHLRGGLRIARETRGSCQPGSDSLPNNVYRCLFGNTIVDPCWRDWRSPAPAAVCLEQPWASTVIRLRLTAAPPPSSGHSNLRTEPWGITLRSGTRCLAFQGAHDTLTGREGAPIIDYYCTNGLALLRGINRTPARWTIRAARVTHKPSQRYALIGRVPIAKAWFGGNNPLSSRP